MRREQKNSANPTQRNPTETPRRPNGYSTCQRDPPVCAGQTLVPRLRNPGTSRRQPFEVKCIPGHPDTQRDPPVFPQGASLSFRVRVQCCNTPPAHAIRGRRRAAAPAAQRPQRQAQPLPPATLRRQRKKKTGGNNYGRTTEVGLGRKLRKTLYFFNVGIPPEICVRLHISGRIWKTKSKFQPADEKINKN